MADADDWKFRRAVARVEAVVDEVVAEFATSFVGRPVRRRDVVPPQPRPGIVWSVDRDLLVEFVHRSDAPDQLLVHDVGVLEVLKKRIRSRHVEVRHVTTTWETD